MLHFEVQTKRGQRADYGLTVKKPGQFPSFVLVFNNDWNDYSYRTWFCLFYFDTDERRHCIGEFKLIKRGVTNTFDALDKLFDGPLSDEFCSLGIESTFYANIYEAFKDKDVIHELLTSLRDCAYNQNIYEEFAEDEGFNTSLLREDSSRQAIKEAAFMLSGKDKTAAYSFNLHFSPDYLEGVYTDWNVKLLYDAPPFMRMVGLIGDNGVGKTQMMKMLLSKIIANDPQDQSVPLFRSCLAISSTPFDRYDNIHVARPRIPFQNFTIEQNTNYTENELRDCINVIKTRPLIYTKSMALLYKEALEELLGENVGDFLRYNEETKDFDLDNDLLHQQISILSSGQLHIFYLLTFIHAHIHLTSLLVIDEPEVHMHPQLIVSFMTMLGSILERFRSYAVIATHSPLIIREMVGQNVYLMRTVDGKIPNVSKVVFETFGADASDLYMNIFHFDERMSSLYRYIRRLGRNVPYEKALQTILKYAPDLGLNARLSIRDYIESEEDA